MNDYPEITVTPCLVKEMDKLDRPREKAFAYGLDQLTDVELMAIIFATGVKGKSVVQLCQEMLDDNGGHLSLLARKTVDELVAEHKGIGPVKALNLLAALKLGERTVRDAKKMYEAKPIVSSQDAYDYMKHHLVWLECEEFWVLYLNRGAKPLKELKISIGTSAFTAPDIKVILKNAITSMAQAIILFHNHPSGQLQPSMQDDKLTKRIAQAAELFDVRVVDHLIVTDSGYYSYADHGKM